MGNLYRFVEPVVLFLLKQKGRSYGYELAGLLKTHALTDATIEPAALYRTLRQLEAEGYVHSAWDVSGRGPARHRYELTDAGRKHLGEWAVVIEKLGKKLTHFVGEVKEALKKKTTISSKEPLGVSASAAKKAKKAAAAARAKPKAVKAKAKAKKGKR